MNDRDRDFDIILFSMTLKTKPQFHMELQACATPSLYAIHKIGKRGDTK